MNERSPDTCELLCLDLPHAERIRASLPTPTALESAASAARAVSDATRLGVALALASGGELCVCDLSWIVGRSQNLVSHHVRALRAGELAASRRVGKLVMYRLTPLGASLLELLLPRSVAVAPDTIHNGRL